MTVAMQVSVFFCALILMEVSAHSAYDNCTSNIDCPSSTRCRCNGDLGYQCRCEDGYVTSARGHECAIASKLWEPCNESTICVNSLTYCNPTSRVCVCRPGFRLSVLNDTCAFPNTKALGESCESDINCHDVFAACNPDSKVCDCGLGFRVKTQAEYDAAPEHPMHCVRESFNLNSPEHCPATTTMSTATPTTSTDTAITTVVTNGVTSATSSATSMPRATSTASSSTFSTIEPTSGATLFTACATNSDCPGNSYCQTRGCNGNICVCDIGYVASRDNSFCFKGKFINEPCTTDSECIAYLSYCSGTCRCTPYVRETINGKCTKTGFWTLGEHTTDSSRCQDPNTVRSWAGMCTCKSGWRPKSEEEIWNSPYDRTECVRVDFSLQTCETTTVAATTVLTTTPTPTRDKNLFQTCSTDGECPVNAGCHVRGCNGKVCTCNVGYIPSADNTACTQGKLSGDTCTSSLECIAFLASCSGTCLCPDTTRVTVNRTCVVWGYSALEEQCVGDNYCWDGNAMCSENRCACKPGYRPKSDEEKWHNPYATTECVENDFTLGCPNAPSVGQSVYAQQLPNFPLR